jgi:hypothetical protein
MTQPKLDINVFKDLVDSIQMNNMKSDRMISIESGVDEDTVRLLRNKVKYNHIWIDFLYRNIDKYPRINVEYDLIGEPKIASLIFGDNFIKKDEEQQKDISTNCQTDEQEQHICDKKL